MRRLGILVLGLVLSPLCPARLFADVMAYAVALDDNLYSVDLTTGAATVIGNDGQFLEGLALSPGGTLFATDASGNLYTINRTTAAATLVGSTGLGDVEGLDFDGSTLIATNFTDPTTIYSINTSTASPTAIVSASTGVVRGMALLDAIDVFVTSDTPVFQSLETISLLSGSVVDVGPLSDTNLIAAMAYNGTLFGLDSGGNEYTINPSNADLTLVGNTGNQFWLDMTLVSSSTIPEPSAVTLFATVIGAIGIGTWRRKRK